MGFEGWKSDREDLESPTMLLEVAILLEADIELFAMLKLIESWDSELDGWRIKKVKIDDQDLKGLSIKKWRWQLKIKMIWRLKWRLK